MNAEIERMIRIDELMKEWATYCHSQELWKNAIFVEDGPFPYYWNQKIKILFIGREAYGMDPSEKNIDYWSDIREPSLGVFQSRLLYLAYGIQHGECSYDDWCKMPDAHRLNAIFAEDAQKLDGAFSNAFMNASKLVNTEGTKIGNICRSFINDKVNRLFFIREIELLAPDIIVSANLNDIGFFSTKSSQTL